MQDERLITNLRDVATRLDKIAVEMLRLSAKLSAIAEKVKRGEL